MKGSATKRVDLDIAHLISLMDVVERDERRTQQRVGGVVCFGDYLSSQWINTLSRIFPLYGRGVAGCDARAQEDSKLLVTGPVRGRRRRQAYSAVRMA